MKPHVCSWRMGFFLDNGFRGLAHNPDRIIGNLVGPGQTAVDLGCGPGFFTIPLAGKVGEAGTVIAADLQPQMLEKVRRKAVKAGLDGQLRLHRCGPERIGLSVPADFILAFYMVHEVPDPAAFFCEINQILKPGGKLLLVEPKFHVSKPHFKTIVAAAEAAGLERNGKVSVALSRGRVFSRPLPVEANSPSVH
jgi:ubiquinone/menaquinone biosynthesis C-methylase UbiE